MFLFDAIIALIEFVYLIFSFIFDFVKDIFFIAELLSEFILYVPGYFSWLPGSLASLLGIILGIVVVYKLLGREG